MPRITQETRTAYFDASCDLTSLASCALAYKAAGIEYLPRSRSALMAAIVDDYAKLLIGMGRTVEIDSIAQAHEVLTRLGFANFHKAGRTRASFLDRLAGEESGAIKTTDRTEEIEKAMGGLL